MTRRIAITLSIIFGVTETAQRPTQSSVTADGHTLTVLTAGETKPGVPAVVFSSGFGANASTWADVQSDVASLTRTVAYDRSGVGQSQLSTRPRTTVASGLHVSR